MADRLPERVDLHETRLFLEEICCNLCRFLHVARDGAAPEAIRIDQEVALSVADAFADIVVRAPGVAAYAVEIKFGYTVDHLLQSLRRKYGPGQAPPLGINRVVLVVDVAGRAGWPATRDVLSQALHPGLALDVWDEATLVSLVRELFDVTLDLSAEDALLDVREAIDGAKGRHAFGDAFTGDGLDTALLWHFGFWRLHELWLAGTRDKRMLVPPGRYQDVAVLMADLSSFSSYVRDTPDQRVMRRSLEAFCARARYEVINAGGMLFQFVGDGVVAMFGLPDRPAGYLQAALDCAEALADIGRSIMLEWQRQIDRAQSEAGVHTGIALGEVQVFSLRPFGRARLGAVGDPLNMAARLSTAARTGEVVVSNTYFRLLDQSARAGFTDLEPLEAKNVGRIRAWGRRFRS